MSPEILGVVIGLSFILPTIYVIRAHNFDAWAWPIILATLPIYYMLFGMLALDGSVVLKELLYGIPYIAIGLLGWRTRSRPTLILIALAWMSHGLYDYYHDFFFVNPGVFSWYPAGCAVVDILVGAYLFASYRRLANPQATE